MEGNKSRCWRFSEGRNDVIIVEGLLDSCVEMCNDLRVLCVLVYDVNIIVWGACGHIRHLVQCRMQCGHTNDFKSHFVFLWSIEILEVSCIDGSSHLYTFEKIEMPV